MQIITVCGLTDNTFYLIHRAGSKRALLIDPAEFAASDQALKSHDLKLELILTTHHHHDHVGGNLELIEKWNTPVYCSQFDQDRVPGATRGFRDGDEFEFDEMRFRVLEIPGHTQGQIAYYALESGSLFVGDTVFAMGCGRLFEGTPEQMWTSLQRICKLPAQTRLYFGHEYTERNAAFALTAEPENKIAIEERLRAARKEIAQNGHANSPTLREELQVNPFLRAPDLPTFTELRQKRDLFRSV